MENLVVEGDISGDYYIKVDYDPLMHDSYVYYKCVVGDASINIIENPLKGGLCNANYMFTLDEKTTNIHYDSTREKLDISFNCGSEKFDKKIHVDRPPKCNGNSSKTTVHVGNIIWCICCLCMTMSYVTSCIAAFVGAMASRR